MINEFKPYPQQKDILDSTKKILALFGGNRVGKTLTGALKTAFDATGVYPSWWNGPRVDKNIRVLVTAPNRCSTEPASWHINEILGEVGATCYTMKDGHIFKKIYVDRQEHDQSAIYFRPYQMLDDLDGKFDIIWVEDECDMRVIDYLRSRLADGGTMLFTLCPISGMTDSTKHLMTSDDVEYRRLPLDDITHIDKKTVDDFKKCFSGKEYEARVNGIPLE